MLNLKKLNQKLEINFRDPAILKQALTHRSFLNEARGKNLQSNERLEFLGDAILGSVVSRWLYQSFTDYPEGTLTNLRSNLVKTTSLAKIAGRLGIGKFLLLSKGEKESGGQENVSLLADTMEAIIGAIFLDQGLETINQFIEKNFQPLLQELLNKGEFKDYKSLLQEKTQSQVNQLPQYQVINEKGPDHAKIFTVTVANEGRTLATAQGNSKQKAEQEAARLALEKLGSKK